MVNFHLSRLSGDSKAIITTGYFVHVKLGFSLLKELATFLLSGPYETLTLRISSELSDKIKMNILLQNA